MLIPTKINYWVQPTVRPFEKVEIILCNAVILIEMIRSEQLICISTLAAH